MKGIRLIKSTIQGKVSYSVDLLFSNQSWPLQELCQLNVSALAFYWVTIMSTVSPCCLLLLQYLKTFPEVLVLSDIMYEYMCLSDFQE